MVFGYIRMMKFVPMLYVNYVAMIWVSIMQWSTGIVGWLIQHKVFWQFLVLNILYIWYVPVSSQIGLEKYSCNIFTCELRYYAYSLPLDEEC